MSSLVIAASTGLIPSSAASPLLTHADDWAAQLRLLGRAGYAHVDLSDLWVPLGELDEQGVDTLAAALADAGMTAVGSSVIGIELHVPEKREAGLRWARTSLANSARLGLTHMSVGLHPRPPRGRIPGGRPLWADIDQPAVHTPEQFVSVADDLRELADEAADQGIGLSLEMHERTLVHDSADSLRLLELIGRDNVGMNPDLGNLIRPSWPLTETWYETVERLAPLIRYWHAKNAVRIELPGGRAASVFAPLESGLIDYRAGIALALRAGFTGPLVVEHYGGDSLAFAASSLKYLRSLLEGDLVDLPIGGRA